MSDEEFNAYSKESLLGKANISDTNLKRIKVAHANILRQLPTQLDQSTYVKGSKGIVMLGGGFYSWLSFLSIMHLRDNGSKLPIELVLASWSDYDKEYHFCHQVLPKYNAKCILMPQVLGHHVISQIGIGSYQLKSIAIAVSSFEHVLMLDSDNVALVNPDTIFDSKVYKDHGLVLWPDYWQRSMSPLYYEIAQIPVNEQVRVRWGRFPLVKPILVEEDGTTINKEKKKQKLNFHEYAGSIPDLSSESGQLLINKGTHAKTLLLSLYYNLYGPDIYYRLFSLGELGEGDKDTFITAAFATQAKYYQVLSHIRTQGFSDENGYHGMAMGQKDPVVDYEVVTKQYAKIERELNRNKSADQFELIDKMQAEYFGGVSEIPLFTLHCNIAKVNPEEYTRNDAVSDLEENRIKARIYSNFKYKIVERDQDREIDFELKRWTIIQQAICIDNLEFYLFDEKDKKKTCDYINNTVRWLISTSDMVDGKSLTSLDRKKPHQPVYNYK
ncbi:Golgi alpha-1,2 mannosyltransferase [Scheffersomyces amazonensis]|uniref:Golgi alpha-1,2 mannosyltransferase n=1 Tax=Scheffersomyces amazonensis TaxID=1078765 RepID=UPI00315D0C85